MSIYEYENRWETSVTEENPSISHDFALNKEKKLSPLISVNLHLTRACNYKCKFCFARFPDLKDSLPLHDAKKLIKAFSSFGTEKITFVGGEPLLYQGLGDLLVYTKKLGITTMIVTNGSLLTPSFLEKFHRSIDWIGLSIDSAKEEIEHQLGRYSPVFRSTHVEHIRALVPIIRQYKTGLKVNTVVTRLNWTEDLSDLIEELQPDRWKIFQVLKVTGENDQTVIPYVISHNQFTEFVKRHKHLNPVCESNDDLIGSYIMVDPAGRFFDNTKGYLQASQQILNVGVTTALHQIQFSIQKLIQRGGLYEWNSTQQNQK
ncbi:MAG: viperin family antiviral radical SAM protein [Candidatus Hermodarchaeota archaeon]